MSIQSVGTGTASILELVMFAEKGLYKLPTVQREFVWKERHIKSFIEALYKGYPVGMIVLWMPADKAAVDSSAFLDPVETTPNFSFVLDGQQRITSLLLVKHGFSITRDGREISRRKLFFSPETAEFKFKRGAVDKKKWIDTSDVLIENNNYYAYMTNSSVKSEARERLRTLKQALSSRMIPVYTVGPQFTYDDVARIFLQMNSAGVKIGTVDMFFSLLGSKLSKTYKEDLLKFHYTLNDSFGNSLRFVVRSLAAILGESQSNFKSARIRQAIETLVSDPEKLKSSLGEAKVYIKALLELLGNLGVDYITFMPSENVLIPLVYYMYLKENKLSATERNHILLWFLLSSFLGRYSSSVDTKLDDDLGSVKKNNDLADLFLGLKKQRGRLDIRIDDFKGKYKKGQLLLLLAAIRARGALDWFGGALVKSSGSSAQHIFPRAYLREHNIKDSGLVHDIANITILTLHANEHMGKNPPEEYFNRNYVGKDKIENHFVPTNEDLWTVDKYPEFLEERRKLMFSGIVDYLESLGLSTIKK
jgi:hypothetical protein